MVNMLRIKNRFFVKSFVFKRCDVPYYCEYFWRMMIISVLRAAVRYVIKIITFKSQRLLRFKFEVVVLNVNNTTALKWKMTIMKHLEVLSYGAIS